MAWTIIDPLIEYWDNHPATELPTYPAGSWGPEEANTLLDGDHARWR
jgi:glucose-6-phosphate 1-dehydrogenase